ncbi:MAG TPA: hypothetical protein VMV06_05210 [Acidimicrobiales bacterium]|nr:hypothetical protein [Acidimicrobiales bacterium]
MFARNGDVEIFYETYGARDDPPLWLVNGLGSQSINYRSELCERFAPSGLFVIPYGNRDVGRDGRPDHGHRAPRAHPHDALALTSCARSFLVEGMGHDYPPQYRLVVLVSSHCAPVSA